jgi:hypothetical protein
VRAKAKSVSTGDTGRHIMNNASSTQFLRTGDRESVNIILIENVAEMKRPVAYWNSFAVSSYFEMKLLEAK